MRTFLLLVFLTFLTVSGAAQTDETSFFIPRPADAAPRYAYISFEMQSKTESLTLSCLYDKKNGANVIDLGLFDPRFDPSKNTTDGFRGWSGGRRNTIFISRDSASHGYLPGEIPAGKWNVILGLYKIAPEGVTVTCRATPNEIDATAKAEFDAENATKFAPPPIKRAPAPKSNGFRWYRGDLHLHTFDSDGNWTARGLLEYSRAANLDFVGLTDHNTTAHHDDVDLASLDFKELLVMRGEEVTTYGGHLNVWGLPHGRLIDFRVTPGDVSRLKEVVADVRSLGLLASINHPTAICGGCGWTYGDDWTSMDSVEIWNGDWDVQDENALRKWDELLRLGKRVTAIGSSDTHRPPNLASEFGTNLAVGTPTTHAGMTNLDQTSLFEAIRAGRVWVSRGPFLLDFTAKGKTKATIGGKVFSDKGRVELSLTADGLPTGAVIKLLSRAGVVKTFDKGFRESFEVTRDDYFRVEIRDSKDSMIALTNPIFVGLKN